MSIIAAIFAGPIALIGVTKVVLGAFRDYTGDSDDINEGLVLIALAALLAK